MRATRAIMWKELRDAVRSRWLIGYATAFAVVALALSQLQGGDIGSQGFNRTPAGLINLCILLVPLLSLVLGAAAIAGERERGGSRARRWLDALRGQQGRFAEFAI